MVALLSQCFNDSKTNNDKSNIVDLNTNTMNNASVNTNNDSLNTNNNANINISSVKPDTSDSILDQQFKELKEYTRYLEKEVEEYKKYIEERFNKIQNQKFNVVEGMDNDSAGSKDINDMLIYVITCVFILLLVDYIFKMGKSSY